MMAVRLILGLLLTVVCLGIAGRRLMFLVRLGQRAQPIEPGRRSSIGQTVQAELVEVAAQRKLLRWSVPGVAHLLVFWGFMVLLLTIIEGFGALVDPHFQIPFFGNWAWFGFVEDLFAILCVLALAIFVGIRIKNAPATLGRRSRFFGSHLGPAWFVLFMIFNVVWTLLAFRGASIVAQGVNEAGSTTMQFLRGAFASQGFAALFSGLSQDAVEVAETVLLLLSLAVLLVFTVFVTYSKHLHIFLSIPNVAYARRPRALGGLLPVYWGGKKVDFEDPGDDDVMGVGSRHRAAAPARCRRRRPRPRETAPDRWTRRLRAPSAVPRSTPTTTRSPTTMGLPYTRSRASKVHAGLPSASRADGRRTRRRRDHETRPPATTGAAATGPTGRVRPADTGSARGARYGLRSWSGADPGGASRAGRPATTAEAGGGSGGRPGGDDDAAALAGAPLQASRRPPRSAEGSTIARAPAAREPRREQRSAGCQRRRDPQRAPVPQGEALRPTRREGNADGVRCPCRPRGAASRRDRSGRQGPRSRAGPGGPCARAPPRAARTAAAGEAGGPRSRGASPCARPRRPTRSSAPARPRAALSRRCRDSPRSPTRHPRALPARHLQSGPIKTSRSLAPLAGPTSSAFFHALRRSWPPGCTLRPSLR
ncbi:MAG: hypothetical protein V9F82_00195 [Dermatophilaceae bacterium]